MLTGNRIPAVALVVALLAMAAAACDDATESSPVARVTYLATASDAGTPAAAALDDAAEVLADRFRAAGLDDVSVRVEADRLVVTYTGDLHEDLLVALAAPGELSFRKVIRQTHGFGPPPEPAALATVPPAGAAERSGVPAPVHERQQAVEEKISGEAMDAAFSFVGLKGYPGDDRGDELLAAIRPFGELTGAEVAVLPAALQFSVESITCEQLDARPPGEFGHPDAWLVVCDGNGMKYLLDTARLHGTDVQEATATQGSASGPWTVNLTFTEAGQQRWTDLTREATQNDIGVAFEPWRLGMNIAMDHATVQWRFDPGSQNLDRYEYTVDTSGAPPPVFCEWVGDMGNCLVAMVLDHQVISAPQIREVISGGTAQIAGSFTADEARLLAEQLSSGTVPLRLDLLLLETVE